MNGKEILFAFLFCLFGIQSFGQEIIRLSGFPTNQKVIGIIELKDTVNALYHLRIAERNYNEQFYQKALNCLDVALQYNEKESKIYLQQAKIYKAIGLSEKRAESLAEAIQLFENGCALPQSPFIVYNSLGTYCLKNQEYEKAEQYFSKALKYRLAPFTIYNRGVSKLYLEKMDESCKDLLAAKEHGIKQADKLLATWCDNCKEVQVFNEVEKYSEDNIDYYLNSLDTVFAKIYFHHDWDIAERRTIISRECSWIKSLQQFDGEFTDYFGANRLAEGCYKNGKKHGIYTKYFEDGNIETVGNFKDDLPFGIWRYYYRDKQLKMIVAFNGPNFDVKAYYDENGKQLLKEGNGKWEHTFSNSRGYVYTLKGQYENFKRVGRWTMDCNPCKQSVVEKYAKDGTYISTKTNIWQYSEKDENVAFSSWIMMELRHSAIKQLRYSTPIVFDAYPCLFDAEKMTEVKHEF